MILGTIGTSRKILKGYSMTDIERHHQLETELYRVRLLRDLGDADYDPSEENAILDEMEATWYRLSEEGQRILEAERTARSARGGAPVPVPNRGLFVDVKEEDFSRRCLPPRRLVKAS